MKRYLTLAVSALLSALPMVSSAGDLTPDEQAFFNRHTSDLVRFETQRLDDPVMQEVFAAPVYQVKIFIGGDDSGPTTSLVVARVGDKLVSVNVPSSDADMPGLLAMLKPGLKLSTTAEASMVQQALDTICPILMSSDKKLKGFSHQGTTWHFVRGEFFESKSGFVFETDAEGKVTAVKYLLRLP